MNFIKGLDATIEEDSIVQKILKTLPPRFNYKVSVLEDRVNLDKLTKYELHGILTSYEMMIKKDNIARKEATFKATRKPKNNKNECKNISDMSHEEESNFVIKLKRGQGKYKGKLPLK